MRLAQLALTIYTIILFLHASAIAVRADDALLGCYSINGPKGRLNLGIRKDEAGYLKVDADGTTRLRRATLAQRFALLHLPSADIGNRLGKVLGDLADDKIYIAVISGEISADGNPSWGATRYVFYYNTEIKPIPLFKVSCPG